MATLGHPAHARMCRAKKAPLSRTPRLRQCPFGRGLVVRVYVMSPKKPNSAKRQVAKVRMYSKPRVTARILGSGFGVSKFSRVLVRGGRANDLPGVGYTLVRGAYDCSPHFGKKKRRSFYGVPRPDALKKHVRRKVRRKLSGL
jgi:small subunit ribosomal protein S12